jgi:hypothetical protein
MPTLHSCVPNTWLAAKNREKTAQNCPQTNAFHVSKMAARHPIGSCSAMATLPLLTFPIPKCAHDPWLHIGVGSWSLACCVAELLRHESTTSIVSSRHAPLAVIARAQTGHRCACRDPAYRLRTFVDPRHAHPRIRVAISHEIIARLTVGMERWIRGAQQAVPKRSCGRWLTLGAIRLAAACLIR